MTSDKPRTQTGFSVKVEELVEYVQQLREGKVVIPKYQRGPVWSDKKKKRLAESIYNGFPVGSLLLYQKSDTKHGAVDRAVDDGDRVVIDGLQRSLAIKELYYEPFKYASLADVLDEAYLQELAARVGLRSGEDVVKLFDPLIRNANNETLDSMEWCFTNVIVKVLGQLQGSISQKTEKNMATIAAVLDRIRARLREVFTEYKIPLIILEGDESVLPEVFYRLNTSGEELTRYQVFAAQWTRLGIEASTPSLKEKEKSLIERIVKKVLAVYEEWEAKGARLDYVLDESALAKELNLFELLLGFGFCLGEDFQELIKEDWRQHIGFLVLCSLLSARTRNPRTVMGAEIPKTILETVLKQSVSGPVDEHVWNQHKQGIAPDLLDWLLTIKEAFDEVNKQLELVFKVKTSKLDKPHALYQLAALVAWLAGKKLGWI